MDVELFREYCLSKPRVTEGMPFGEDVLVFKVGGKMFALVALDFDPQKTAAAIVQADDVQARRRSRGASIL